MQRDLLLHKLRNNVSPDRLPNARVARARARARALEALQARLSSSPTHPSPLSFSPLPTADPLFHLVSVPVIPITRSNQAGGGGRGALLAYLRRRRRRHRFLLIERSFLVLDNACTFLFFVRYYFWHRCREDRLAADLWR